MSATLNFWRVPTGEFGEVLLTTDGMVALLCSLRRCVMATRSRPGASVVASFCAVCSAHVVLACGGVWRIGGDARSALPGALVAVSDWGVERVLLVSSRQTPAIKSAQARMFERGIENSIGRG